MCRGSGEILRTKYSQSGFKALHVGVCPACGGKGIESKVFCGRWVVAVVIRINQRQEAGRCDCSFFSEEIRSNHRPCSDFLLMKIRMSSPYCAHPPICSCKGEGRARVRKRVSVKVPAGMDEGHVLRLKGLGDAGVAGGQSGDLVLRFQVIKH